MSINPYQPPEIPSEQAEARTFGLYSPGHMAWATFLGSPLAGCILLALNYLRLADPRSAWITMTAGTLFTAVLFTVAMFLPDNFPSLVIPLASTFGMMYLGKALQGPALEQHLRSGGKKGSAWVTTGVGILTAIVVVGLFLGALLLMPEEWFPE